MGAFLYIVSKAFQGPQLYAYVIWYLNNRLLWIKAWAMWEKEGKLQIQIWISWHSSSGSTRGFTALSKICPLIPEYFLSAPTNQKIHLKSHVDSWWRICIMVSNLGSWIQEQYLSCWARTHLIIFGKEQMCHQEILIYTLIQLRNIFPICNNMKKQIMTY